MANRYFSHYLAMVGGATIVTVADLKTIAEVLQAVRPTVFLGVPAFWHKIQATLGHAIAAPARFAPSPRREGFRHGSCRRGAASRRLPDRRRAGVPARARRPARVASATHPNRPEIEGMYQARPPSAGQQTGQR
jgi:hypothetical protein